MGSQTQIWSPKQCVFLFVFTSVDPSKIGELHLQATCYVYVLRPRSVLLKQLNLPGFARIKDHGFQFYDPQDLVCPSHAHASDGSFPVEPPISSSEQSPESRSPRCHLVFGLQYEAGSPERTTALHDAMGEFHTGCVAWCGPEPGTRQWTLGTQRPFRVQERL